MDGKENQPERPRRKIVLGQGADRRGGNSTTCGQQQDLQETSTNTQHEGSKTHRSTLSLGALQ